MDVHCGTMWISTVVVHFCTTVFSFPTLFFGRGIYFYTRHYLNKRLLNKMTKLKWKQYFQFYNTIMQSVLTGLLLIHIALETHQTTTKLNHQPSRDFVENSAGIWTLWYAFNSFAKINMLCRFSARCRVRHDWILFTNYISIFQIVLAIYTTFNYIKSTNKSLQTCVINS